MRGIWHETTLRQPRLEVQGIFERERESGATIRQPCTILGPSRPEELRRISRWPKNPDHGTCRGPEVEAPNVHIVQNWYEEFREQ